MAADDIVKVRSEDLSWRDIDGEIVVLDLRRSVYINLNPSGSVLWNRLQVGATRGELIDALLAEFDVDESTAARDADAFLELCREHDLLAG